MTDSKQLDVQELFNRLQGVGVTWARYGLNLGKSALETSAETLKTTAATLGDLAQKFGAEGANTAPKN